MSKQFCYIPQGLQGSSYVFSDGLHNGPDIVVPDTTQDLDSDFTKAFIAIPKT